MVKFREIQYLAQGYTAHELRFTSTPSKYQHPSSFYHVVQPPEGEQETL